MKSKNLINGQKPEFGNLEQIKILQKEAQKIEDEKEYVKAWSQMNAVERWIDTESQIGWSMFAIDELVKLVTQKLGNRSPIDLMIDKVTCYEAGVIKGFLIIIKGHYKMLIKSFKYLENKKSELHYQQLLDKVNNALKTEYKKVKTAPL